MRGLYAEHEHTLLVAVKLGPVEVHEHVALLGEDPSGPDRLESLDVDLLVADETVDLFDGVLVIEPVDGRKPAPDSVNAQLAGVHHADNTIGQRRETLRVHVTAEELVHHRVSTRNGANMLGFGRAANRGRANRHRVPPCETPLP